MVRDTALSDTFMFTLGMCVGVLINMIFKTVTIDTQHEIFVYGLLQIMFNAFIIRFVTKRVQCIGLFTLGLISFQSLIIKRVFD